jgi:stringent starvation protein B
MAAARFGFCNHRQAGGCFLARWTGGRKVSILVPIILAVALAVSFYGQGYRNWQNNNAGQNDNSEKSADNSSEDKSDQSDKDKSDDNSKSGKSRNPAAASKKGRDDEQPHRQ